MKQLADKKTETVSKIIHEYGYRCKKILAIGCGSGTEVAILSRQLGADVIGIDLKDDFDLEASQYAKLQVGDATSLEFDDESFDFVYSYHALEHIHDPRKAISEIHRVLTFGGGYWVGTPNRSRILGYVSSRNVSLATKIKWNYEDWRSRIKGEFRNELGAHAGFTCEELRQLLEVNFIEPYNVTLAYYRKLYAQYLPFIEMIDTLHVGRFILPSVYFLGTKLCVGLS